ncbi:fungal specific transcription factor [Colletotrichum costaricense]|uniref:Fungal specific transcription factor n=2 Tax=Colletotrichum acutatum species complex TaxID=2707335 RepID=A0AAI9YEK5_9PEZI|nr:fungal specific transcription factor [Colletotrichum costaricense]KAK1503903.1 fungal specific transcription factor [Colletotrichum costaricense]
MRPVACSPCWLHGSIADPTVTISSQLCIKSLLSPASDSDDALTALPTQATPKGRCYKPLTRQENTSTTLAVAKPASKQAPEIAIPQGSIVPDGDDSKATSARGSSAKRPSRAMQPPMRSSIACLRCRKSKTKCDNDNTGSPCDTCIKAGHNCEFPDPKPLPAKRSKPPTVPRQVVEVRHVRKRVKKLEDATSSDGRTVAALAQEVLSATYLTVELWHQLFDIFKLHFATELPFLHLPTLKSVYHNKESKKPSTESNLILLGILTLTARLHPDLIKYAAHLTHDKIADPKSRSTLFKSEPPMASEYFSNALTKALGELESALTSATVVRVQAFLMLGLHKWSQPNGGLAAWIFAGGRHTESLPPWDQASTFYQLIKKVDAFYAHLPEEFTWSSSNFWKHESSIYVSLHMLGALCKIMLHREYIPFIAIKCSEPVGPLDAPVFDRETEIEERNSGTMSENTQTGNTSIAFQALTKAAPYQSMASNYVTYLKYIDQYLTKVYSDYTIEMSIISPGSRRSTRRRSPCQASSFTVINAALSPPAGGISHQPPSQNFPPTPGFPPGKVAMFDLIAETVDFESHVHQNQGQRLGIMFGDLQKFAAGGMFYAPDTGEERVNEAMPYNCCKSSISQTPATFCA